MKYRFSISVDFKFGFKLIWRVLNLGYMMIYFHVVTIKRNKFQNPPQPFNTKFIIIHAIYETNFKITTSNFKCKIYKGCRVLSTVGEKKIGPCMFKGFGAHVDEYPFPYFTAAAAIGLTIEDVDLFVKRIKKVFVHFDKKLNNSNNNNNENNKNNDNMTITKANQLKNE